MTLACVDLCVDRGRRQVLHGVSLALEPGEVLALVGPNGAGKSTLLRTLCGDLAIASGSVTLDGAPLRTWSPRAVARRRAVLTQRPTLGAAFRIEDVVQLGRHPLGTSAQRDAAAVRRALVSVGMQRRARSLWTRLSGGEQQRVMLARVLAQVDGSERPILLLDEPTSALDLAWSHRVLELARSLSGEGASVVVVLHDLGLAARYADRVAVLSEGRLLGLGTPRDVLTPDALARAWGVSARWVEVGDDGVVPVVTGVSARPTPSLDSEVPCP